MPGAEYELSFSNRSIRQGGHNNISGRILDGRASFQAQCESELDADGTLDKAECEGGIAGEYGEFGYLLWT